MSSIVLSQSGLYSSTIILALNRGAHMDAFCALVGVTNQEFGWYSEINEIVYHLSDPIFMECIIYLQSIAMEYFDCIQSKCSKISASVLKRLRHQLDPFTPIFRPVVSQLSSNFIESDSNDLNKKLIEFCKHLIETFLIVIIKLYSIKCARDEITNGLNVISVHHEQNQFAIKIDNSSTISAGFSHCAAIIDGSCYLWGSNGINCALFSTSSSSGDFGTESTPKCLEFISNMGLEVHAVRCGKAHTLILTNNGLYAMGSNLLSQLGIGKHHVQALQPMLVPEFDGKNISLIEAGQYHNAVYADGQLFSWGWGIYGQLGHGNVFTQDHPKPVQFFDDKEIKQISLGHAHSLILCSNNTNAGETILFVFGCNLFGQLGVGQYSCDSSSQKFLKSSIPIRINISGEIIAQIHTKFFANFVVTRSNKLYTWGASPQLIRLMNQARKRARLAQQCEDTKTVLANESSDDIQANRASNEFFPDFRMLSDRENKENIKNIVLGTDSNLNFDLNDTNKAVDHSNEYNRNRTTDEMNSVEKRAKNDDKNPLIMINSAPQGNLEDRIKKFLRSKAAYKPLDGATAEQGPSNIDNGSGLLSRQNEERSADEEYTDHLYPAEVDTTGVVGDIIQVSSGLYHNALVTNTLQLYTWGKNLEKQLGRESSRCDFAIPTHLELNDNVVNVECGADFTIILTDHFTVKAFGNNNSGQCGREMSLTADRNGIAGKLVRLRVSKRVVRLPDTSHCIDQPMDVPLPRPKIRMNFDAVRYLKSIPKFRPEFISREIFRLPGFMENLSPSSENYECSLSPDVIETNISTNIRRHSAINLSNSSNITLSMPEPVQSDVTSEFVHYCLFILHGIYNPHKILEYATFNEFKVRILMLNYYVKDAFSLCLSAAKETIAMNQHEDLTDINETRRSPIENIDKIMLSSYVIKLFEYFTKDANIVPIHRTDLKYLIHAIFMYFIQNSLPLEPIEFFFLTNIDHYLFGLAFVLFFNNNNTKLEQKVQRKYTHLFSGCLSNEHVSYLYDGVGDGSNSTDNDHDTAIKQENRISKTDEEFILDFELIFKNISTSFKTVICQRLIEFDNDLN